MNFLEFDRMLEDPNIEIKLVDWNRYRELFPERYFRYSEFDNYVTGYINHLYPRVGMDELRFLDIGSGKVEDGHYPDCRRDAWEMVDPYVLHDGEDSDPNYYSYDLIRCRGSLLYMSQGQIDTALCCLRGGGVLLANFPFSIPKNSLKRYETCDGKPGWERAILHENIGMISHYLKPDHENVVYHHRMNAWTPKKLYDMVRLVDKDSFCVEFLVFGENTGIFKVTNLRSQ